MVQSEIHELIVEEQLLAVAGVDKHPAKMANITAMRLARVRKYLALEMKAVKKEIGQN